MVRFKLILSLTFWCCLTFGQDQKVKTSHFDQRMDVVLGIGVDHSIAAPLVHLKLYKRLYAMGSWSYYKPYGFLANIGLEYRFPFPNDRWCPFIKGFIGDNRPTVISIQPSPREFVRITRVFQSPAFGIGIKFKIHKNWRNYLTISYNYSWPIHIEKDFFRDLNSTTGTDYFPTHSFTPSIGLSIYPLDEDS